MADIVSKEARSRMMSGIRSKNTKPELVIRKGLHALGFRFVLHDRRLAGTPDIVLPKYRAAIFVHGCFWHGHDCSLFRWPATRQEFWRPKIERNKRLDEAAESAILVAGWRCAVIWECALRGTQKLGLDAVLKCCAQWIQSDEPGLQLRES
jgi:DNA mismatch endonuclease (patch repair protein)